MLIIALYAMRTRRRYKPYPKTKNQALTAFWLLEMTLLCSLGLPNLNAN